MSKLAHTVYLLVIGILVAVKTGTAKTSKKTGTAKTSKTGGKTGKNREIQNLTIQKRHATTSRVWFTTD